MEGTANDRVAYFSNEVRVSLGDSTVYEGDRELRTGSTVCFPAGWRNDNSLVAFSLNGAKLAHKAPVSWKDVHIATFFFRNPDGLKKGKTIKVKARQFSLQLKPGIPVLLVPGKL